jgi:hypothetical protein
LAAAEHSDDGATLNPQRVRTPPAVNAAPPVLKISLERQDEPADTPLGDWQT